MLLHPVDKISANNYSNIWSNPPSYQPLKLFPLDVVHLLGSINKDYPLCFHGRHLSMTQFNKHDPTVLPDHERTKTLELQPCYLPNAGDDVFMTVLIGARQFIGYYYREFVYENKYIGPSYGTAV